MRILIPTPLRPYVDKQSAVELPATTVGEALYGLTQKYPDLKKHLFTEGGQLRAFVNVYVNDEDIRHLSYQDTPIAPSDTMSIVPSIAGGK